MAEYQNIDKALLEQLLADRDEQYRRAELAESRLAALTDAKALEGLLAQKDAIIARQNADLAKKEQEHEAEKTRMKKEHAAEIARLMAWVEYLKKKLWGQMTEKRKVPDNPGELRLDFDESDLSDEDRAKAEAALARIKAERDARKTITVKEHTKQVPVRHKLPDTLRREEIHIYPDGYLGHEDEWILFKDVEVSGNYSVPL